MTKKRKEPEKEKLEISIRIDAEVWADAQAHIITLNEECECGQAHTLDDEIEGMLKYILRNTALIKALNKYR